MSNLEILTEISEALGAHGAWKMKLKVALNGDANSFDVADVRKDNLCQFGKWLYGPSITDAVRTGKPYQVIRRLHSEFHQCASEVLDHAQNGRQSEAERLFEGEYLERSSKLARALSKWRREIEAGSRSRA